jgi:hypothetical protein
MAPRIGDPPRSRTGLGRRHPLGAG